MEMKKNYVTQKYNAQTGNSHRLDKFDNLADAIKSAKALHDPSWASTQGITVSAIGSRNIAFDTNK